MVEWKKLGEVCTILRGNRVTKGELVDNGKFPVISGGVTPMGFIDSYNREPNTITVSQYGTAGYVDFQYSRFWANDICYCVYPENSVDNKYLWYVLKSKQDLLYAIRNTDATPYSLPVDTLKSILIPIPSLEEQARIVGILDTFTSAIDNLKEQIAQRRKQYEYYRDQLLDFEGKPGVEMKKVAYFVKERILANELTAQNYTSVENLLKDKAGRKDAENVPSEGNWIRYQKGDVLIGNIRPYLRKIWLSDREGGTNGDVIVIRSNDTLLPEFIFYCLASDSFFLYYNQALKDGKMPRGEKKRVLSYVIPSVGKEEQQRIVSILDTFEASIQNLEAQLEQRQKQYEYYRNKLMTFERENEKVS